MEDKNILLSVIITVYNVAPFIDKCINSVLAQTYKNIEIILVDDGSTDASGKICDEYARKYEQIAVVHQENGGVISARYQGVKRTEGTVLTFVDGDDWIEDEMYQNMMQKYRETGADIVTSGLIYEAGNKISLETDTITSGYFDEADISEHIIPVMMYDESNEKRGIVSSVCTKLFKADLLRKAIEKADLNISIGEDAAILYPLITQARSMTVTHDCWYHYIIHDDSMMRRYNIQSFTEINTLKLYLQDFFEKAGISEGMDLQIQQYIFPFLETAIRDVYMIQSNKVSYIFPYEAVPFKSKIALYGAGNVGRSYWNCLNSGSYADVTAVFDMAYKEIGAGFPVKVKSPNEIDETMFDYIVIAMEDKDTAFSIIAWLKEKCIDEEKIIWKKPVKILDVV